MLQRLLEALKKFWDLLPVGVQVVILSWVNHQLYQLMQLINYQLELRAT